MDLVEMTDLNIIIFLVAKKHDIVNSRLDNNKSIIFFKDSHELQIDILKYVNGKEIINITDYQASAQRVKTLLDQNKKKIK